MMILHVTGDLVELIIILRVHPLVDQIIATLLMRLRDQLLQPVQA